MTKLADCPCSGATLNKLVQPALLATLARGPIYGYRIAEELARLTIVKGERPDTTGLYRTLRAMERRGLVVSKWAQSKVGPDRRLYRLTPAGTACLERWVQTLLDYHRGIADLLAKTRAACVRLRPSRRKGDK